MVEQKAGWDIIVNPLILKEFRDYPETRNIELGAGCGDFGQRYFRECFLTDKKTPSELKRKCKSTVHVTITCDANRIPCENDRFQKVIMCNPYGYGFRDQEDSQRLLSELHRVTRNLGEVMIVVHHSNAWAAPHRIEKGLKVFNSENVKFEIKIEEIEPNREYGEFVFRTLSGHETSPSRRVTLKCQK